MRIYGHSLTEILAGLPWQFKIIVLVGTMWIPFSIIRATYVYMSFGKSVSVPAPVQFSPTFPHRGLLDPALADGPRNKAYMAYTAVTDYRYDDRLMTAPHVMLAHSYSPCKLWTTGTDIFPTAYEEIIGPDSVTPLGWAAWWTETPGLVYDPGDPGREYKVFAYKYFWADEGQREELARLYGTIVYKYTSDPEMDQWSTEQWLFSAKRGQPPEPYGALVQHFLNDMDPSLAEMYFYSRPSAVMLGDTMYMTLSAFIRGRKTVDRTIMIASPDHGRSWRYLGTLMRHDDAHRMGKFEHYNGGSLFVKDGKLYFAAVFGDRQVSGRGTSILAFADPAQAKLKTDGKTGLPQIVDTIGLNSQAPGAYGGGHAAYNQKCEQGMLVSEFSGIRKSFQIFNTLQEPLD